MFPGITATGTVAAATAWSGLTSGVVLLVIGLGLMFMVGGWIIRKTVKR